MKVWKSFLLVIMALSFLLCACSSDDNDTPQKKKEKRRRRKILREIRVTAKTLTYQSHQNDQVPTTEEGSKTIELTGLSLPKLGPNLRSRFKDFVAQLECSVNNYNYSQTFHARIYICRDKEPFVIKAEDEDKTISLKYAQIFKKFQPHCWKNKKEKHSTTKVSFSSDGEDVNKHGNFPCFYFAISQLSSTFVMLKV